MMIEVGILVRDVGASGARAIEDELDCEHLPYTHASSFAAVALCHADRDGWAADVVLRDGTPMEMRVTLDADRRGYTNANFNADGAENGRAVCRIEATGDDSCRMALRFFAPDRPGLDRAAVGAFYVELFGRLIDEDEPKMMYRSRALREGAKLHKPRRRVTLAEGSVCDVPLVCPHQGLPLDGDPDEQGVITCRWHGYRFDARSGACISGQIKGWRGDGDAATSSML